MEKIILRKENASIEIAENGSMFALKSIDIDGLGSTSDVYKAMSQQGQSFNEGLLNPRLLPCEVYIKGIENGKYSHEKFLALKKQLFDFVKIGEVLTLIYCNENGSYEIDVRIEERNKPEKTVGEVYSLSLDFIADFPLFRETTPFTATLENGESCTFFNDCGVVYGFEIEFDFNTNTDDLVKLSDGAFYIGYDDFGIRGGGGAAIFTPQAKIYIDTEKTTVICRSKPIALDDSRYIKVEKGLNTFTYTGNSPCKIKIERYVDNV